LLVPIDRHGSTKVAKVTLRPSQQSGGYWPLSPETSRWDLIGKPWIRRSFRPNSPSRSRPVVCRRRPA